MTLKVSGNDNKDEPFWIELGKTIIETGFKKVSQQIGKSIGKLTGNKIKKKFGEDDNKDNNDCSKNNSGCCCRDHKNGSRKNR